MFILNICYRAREPQTFRRNELKIQLNNIETFFSKNNLDYRVVICEQNDSDLFNRGKLLNIAFIESEKLFTFTKMYIHINTDYTFDLYKIFPKEILNFKKGFLDLLNYYPYPVLGGCCLFDEESYRVTNGFPNDLKGWGGDDWAIFRRINIKGVIYKKMNGYVREDRSQNYKRNIHKMNGLNINLSKRNDIESNGLSSCKYKIDSEGEFHDNEKIFHYLVTFL